MNNIKVSVIIPVYNTEMFIHETLLCILNQTLKEIEIIIVNDGSTDNSLPIIQELAKNDNRIQIYSQKNQGQSTARNIGIKKAHGEYLYFMDSDDILDTDTLECCYRECNSRKADLLFFDADILNPKNNYPLTLSYHRTQYTDAEQNYTGPEIVNLQLKTGAYRASVCLNLIQKKYLDRIGLTFYPGIIHEDELFTAQLYLQAQKVICIPRAFFKRRLRDDSTMTRKFSRRNIDCYFTVAQQLLRFADNQKTEIKNIVDTLLKKMLNAAVYNSHKLPFHDRLQVCSTCLRYYRHYIHIKTLAVLWLKK